MDFQKSRNSFKIEKKDMYLLLVDYFFTKLKKNCIIIMQNKYYWHRKCGWFFEIFYISLCIKILIESNF